MVKWDTFSKQEVGRSNIPEFRIDRVRNSRLTKKEISRMRKLSRQLVGYTLLGAAIIGILFSAWGLITVWRMRTPIAAGLTETLDLLDSTLQASADGLMIADDSLGQTSTAIGALEDTFQATGRTLDDSTELVNTMIGFFGQELPDTITATQTSLISAQASARVIDTTLRAMSNIPILPLPQYNPPVPLQDSLQQVSESLDPLQGSFESLESTLRSSRGNLILIGAEFDIITRQVQAINLSLTNSRAVVQDYQDVVADLQDRVNSAQAGLPRWISNLTWITTLLLIWLAITQVGLFVQGLEMLGVFNDQD